MGKATAMEFVRRGANVAIADMNTAAGRDTLGRLILQRAGRAILVVGDIAHASVCQRVVRRTVEEFGGVDVVFNNVGIQPPESNRNVEELSDRVWDRVIDVNLKSYYLMAKYAVPELRKRGGGVIINNASVQALQSQKGVPAYAASKGGVLALTRQLAVEYAKDNIRVLAICPGTIEAEMGRAAAASQPDGLDAALERWGKRHPLGRIGTPQDVANVVTFLASERAGFMTGEFVCVDGGYMALGAWAD
jgi:NAD(P)-dependent dehydrogenase (short-subunit alcohol dehydrogenase family)